MTQLQDQLEAPKRTTVAHERKATAPDAKTTGLQTAPVPWRWTLDEYYKIAGLGLLRENRPMLIDGEILLQMTIKPPHTTAVEITVDVLRGIFKGMDKCVRSQQPFNIGQAADPEPDIAVVAGTQRDYARKHPTSAVLIVEVSDVFLAYDRRDKASLYAAADIEDYWIVNLEEEQLEVHRRPVDDAASRFGHRYGETRTLAKADQITPLAAPDRAINVADLLP